MHDEIDGEMESECRATSTLCLEHCPFAVEHRYASGGEVLRALEVPTMVQVVRRGLVALASEWGSHSAVCAVRGPGAFLGMEAIGARLAEHRVVALTDVVVWRASGDRFLEWVGATSSAAHVRARAVERAVQVRPTERRALDGSALRRVAGFLARAHDLQPGAPICVASHAVAMVLRMRPETFSRTVTSLRRSGLLGNGPALEVLDVAGLRCLGRELAS